MEVSNTFTAFQKEEERIQTMMGTYFKLFEDPNEFVGVMDSL